MDTLTKAKIDVYIDDTLAKKALRDLSRPIRKKLEIAFDKRPLGKISSSFAEFDKSIDAATARVLAFAGTTGVIYNLGASIRRLVKDFISVESAMTSIQAITKSTSAEMKNFTETTFKLANETSTSFSDVAMAMQEFARQGLNLEKAAKATASSLAIAKLSGTDLKQAIDGLIATTNSFTNELLEYQEAANVLTSVDAKFATSAGGLIDGIKRVGAVAADAGLQYRELVSVIASIKQVSGRSEAIIGNGLKTIITNLQTEKVQKELNAIGISTRTASGEFAGLISIINQLGNAYSKLDDTKVAEINQRIAGKYQINQLKALISAANGGSESSILSRALSVANNDADEIATRMELISKTTESSLTRLQNKITEVGAGIGNKIAKPVIAELTNIAELGLNKVGEVFKDNNPLGNIIANSITSILQGPGIVIAFNTITKLVSKILKESAQAIAAVGKIGVSERNNLIINQEILNILRSENVERVLAIKYADTLAAKQKLLSESIARSFSPYSARPPIGFDYAAILGNKDRGKLLNRAKNAAGGIIPAVVKESIDIQNGVGGASRGARPIVKTLNLANGSEKVVVNTDEHIVKNYMGSGKDAVFNRDMTRSAGGVSNLRKFGNVMPALAGGIVPNLAVRAVYRGYDPTGDLQGLTGPTGPNISIDNSPLSDASRSLRSNTAVDFLMNTTLEAVLNKNITGLTNSSSLSASAALRFGSGRTQLRGFARDLVRVISPKALERFSMREKKRGSMVSLGRTLYNIAREKPFGIDANQAYDYVQSKFIGDYMSGQRRNPYPIEREINLFDPSGKVFSRGPKLDSSYSDVFTKPINAISHRLFDKKFKSRMEHASVAAYGDFGPQTLEATIADKYRRNIDSIIERSFFRRNVLLNYNKKFRSAKEQKRYLGDMSSPQIASGHIPYLAKFGNAFEPRLLNSKQGVSLPVTGNMAKAVQAMKETGLYFPDYNLGATYTKRFPSFAEKAQGLYFPISTNTHPGSVFRSNNLDPYVYGHEYGHFVDDIMGVYTKKYNDYFSDTLHKINPITIGKQDYRNNPNEIFADTYANMLGIKDRHWGFAGGRPGSRNQIEDSILSFFQNYHKGKFPGISEMINKVAPLRGPISTAAGGYNPLMDSIFKEQQALVSMGFAPNMAAGSIRVGSTPRLKTQGNPLGLGVYNTLQGQTSVSHAVGQHGGIPYLATKKNKYGVRPNLTEQDKLDRYTEIQSVKEAERTMRKFGNSVKSAEQSITDLSSATSNSVKSEQKVSKVSEKQLRILSSSAPLIQLISGSQTTSSGGAVTFSRSPNYGIVPTNLTRFRSSFDRKNTLSSSSPYSTVPFIIQYQNKIARTNFGPFNTLSSSSPYSNLPFLPAGAINPGVATTTASGVSSLSPVSRSEYPPVLNRSVSNIGISVDEYIRQRRSGLISSPEIKLDTNRVAPPVPIVNSPIFGPKLQNPELVRRRYTADYRSRSSADIAAATMAAIPIPRAERRDKFGFTALERRAGLQNMSEADRAIFRSQSRSDQEAFVKQKASERAGRRGQLFFGASFLAPVALSSAAETFGGNETKTGRLLNSGGAAVGAGLSTAALLGGGPIGVGLGIALAGTQLASSFKREQFNPEKEVKAFESIQASFTNRQEVISNYLQGLSTVEELKASGAPLSRISRARSNLSEIGLQLGADAGEISSFNGNQEKIADYLSKLQSEGNREVSASAASKFIAELSAKQNSSLFDVKSGLSNKDGEAKKIANLIVGGLNLENVSGSQLRNVASSRTFTRTLSDLGLSEDKVSEIYSQLKDGFTDGVESVNDELKKLLLTLSRYKELDSVNQSLEKNRVAVVASSRNLVSSYTNSSTLQLLESQGKFSLSSGLAKNILAGAQESGAVTDIALQAAGSKLNLSTIQNDFLNKNTELFQSYLSDFNEISGSLASEQDRIEFLKLLPKVQSGALSPLQVSDEVRSKFSSDTDFIDKFSSQVDQLIIKEKQLLIEKDNAIRLEKQYNAITQKRLENTRLTSLSGANLGENRITALQQYVSGIGASGKTGIGAAEQRIQAALAEQAGGFGITSIPDKFLDSKGRELKKQALESRKTSLLQDYEERISSLDSSSQVPIVQKQIEEVNKRFPGAISKEAAGKIIGLVKGGAPTAALDVLRGIQGNFTNISEFSNFSKPGNFIKNVSGAFSFIKRKSDFLDATSGLEGALSTSEVLSNTRKRRAEALFEKEFPSDKAPQGFEKNLRDANAQNAIPAVEKFISSLDSSKMAISLTQIDNKVARIVERFNKGVDATILEGKIRDLATQRDKILSEGDKNALEIDTSSITVKVPGTGMIGLGRSEVKVPRSFNNGLGDIIRSDEASERLKIGKQIVRERVDLGQSKDKIIDSLPNTVISPDTVIGKEFIRFTDELIKLKEINDQILKLQKEQESIKNSSAISLDVNVSANDLMKDVIETPEFKTGLQQLITESYARLYKNSTGKNPVIIPTAVA